MEYEIVSKHSRGNYKLGIKGSTDEIKSWLDELIVVAGLSPGGYYYSQLKNHINNLENIVEPISFSFGINHTIQITGNSIDYKPKLGSTSRMELCFDDFMVYFNKIKKNMERNNYNLESR